MPSKSLSECDRCILDGRESKKLDAVRARGSGWVPPRLLMLLLLLLCPWSEFPSFFRGRAEGVASRPRLGRGGSCGASNRDVTLLETDATVVSPSLIFDDVLRKSFGRGGGAGGCSDEDDDDGDADDGDDDDGDDEDEGTAAAAAAAGAAEAPPWAVCAVFTESRDGSLILGSESCRISFVDCDESGECFGVERSISSGAVCAVGEVGGGEGSSESTGPDGRSSRRFSRAGGVITFASAACASVWSSGSRLPLRDEGVGFCSDTSVETSTDRCPLCLVGRGR